MASATETDSTMLLTVNQVAQMLGCSVRHVWRMADSGEFPRPVAIGVKLKRWPRTTIEQWIKSQQR